MTSVPSPNHENERFTRWVREHAQAIQGFLCGLVRRADVAEDLLQETFRRAWESRERYADQNRERSYLLRIADRLAVDYCRQQPRAAISLTSVTGESVSLVGNEPAPDHALERNEEQLRLQRALEALSELQRRVLLLRFFGELDFAEIAAQLDCPLNTALSHCHRGLQQLRKTLGSEHDHE